MNDARGVLIHFLLGWWTRATCSFIVFFVEEHLSRYILSSALWLSDFITFRMPLCRKGWIILLFWLNSSILNGENLCIYLCRTVMLSLDQPGSLRKIQLEGQCWKLSPTGVVRVRPVDFLGLGCAVTRCQLSRFRGSDADTGWQSRGHDPSRWQGKRWRWSLSCLSFLKLELCKLAVYLVVYRVNDWRHY